MQELAWLVVNDCDFAKAKSENLSLRSPFLEYVMSRFLYFFY